MARLVLHQLSKIFAAPKGREIRAVDQVTLAIEDSQLLVLLGPSGSGKTVLLRLIAGLEHPSGGLITLGETNLNEVPARERNIGMVFQNPALYPHLSVQDNLGFGLRIRKVPRADADRQVQETADLLGLTDSLKMRPAELSGGQRQRVALGRVLVRRPALVLFDEPFSSLDPPLRFELREQLARLQAAQGWTGIYVTHDQVEAMAFAGQTAVIRAGRLQQTGTLRELYENPTNRFVAEFIGSPPMNIFEGRLLARSGQLVFEVAGTDETLAFLVPEKARQHLSNQVGKEWLAGFRPEHIEVISGELPPATPGPEEIEVSGIVERFQWLGAEALVQVRVPKPQGTELNPESTKSPIRVWARTRAGADLRRGEEVRLLFQLRGARFFAPEKLQTVS